jgi:hypothetical protein
MTAPLPLADVERMRRMRANGARRSEIHDAFPKLSRAVIWKYTRDVGRDDNRGRPRTFDYAKAFRLLDQGLSCTVVAQRFGVTTHAIWIARRRRRQGTL